MKRFFEILKEHRNKSNVDRSVLEKLAHINYQTIMKIEQGEFDSVQASDLLSYLRVMGFKISAGQPRLNIKKEL